MKFTVRAIVTMSRPGHQNSHGRVANASWYWLISCPSDTFGYRMPRPTKLSAVSSRMAELISSVWLTMMTPIEFGSMCLKMILRSLAPATRAASTNSRSRSDRNSPRTSRASVVHDARPRKIASR